MSRALITGITGQDGSYLAELLLRKGYSVSGIVRANDNYANIADIKDKITFIEGTISDRQFVAKVVEEKFDEIYNLASVATVADPWEGPIVVGEVTGMAPLYFLESIRLSAPRTKFFQASSAEMFGAATETPQNEKTPCMPVNPYGTAKLFAHRMVELYRSSQNLFAVSGILFNHESPRRPESFVTRKITATLARISNGSDEVLALGNLNALRDWSYAGDVVEGMWMSLQHEAPDTYVFASGLAHTVRQFVEATAKVLGMDITWEGIGEQEVGKDTTGKVLIKVDSRFFRPLEATPRRGDISKVTRALGWMPKTTLEELARMMVEADLKKS